MEDHILIGQKRWLDTIMQIIQTVSGSHKRYLISNTMHSIQFVVLLLSLDTSNNSISFYGQIEYINPYG